MILKQIKCFIVRLSDIFKGDKVEEINKKAIQRYKKNRKTPTIALKGFRQKESATFYTMQKHFFEKDWYVIVKQRSWKRRIDLDAEDIKKYVENILSKTKANKVNFICYCYGGLVAKYYIELLGGIEKVNKVVMIGVPQNIKWLTDNSLKKLLFLSTSTTRSSYIKKDLEILKELTKKNQFRNFVTISSTEDWQVPEKYAKSKFAKRHYGLKGIDHFLFVHDKRVYDIIEKELK